jgi:hypothetical protein
VFIVLCNQLNIDIKGEVVFMKKVLSLILVLTLSLGMVTSSFANSKLGNGEVKVLKDNENVRIVEGDDDKETIKMIVNKKKNTCEIIITKKSTKKTIIKEIKLNSGVSNNKTLVESDSLSKSSANNYQKNREELIYKLES